MVEKTEKPNEFAGTDIFHCEYVPFGAQDKIKLSFNLILRWLAVKTAKGAVPCEQDLMKFLMTCKAKRLNPFDGDAFLIGYDGKDGPVFSTIVAHQAFLKRAETHPEFDGMESGVIIKQGDEIKELVGDFFPNGSVLLGGWATVYFVNRRHPMTKRLKLSTFDKGRSLWKSNPEGMIVKCAEADALRSSFPQLIGGMYLREEMDAGAAQNAGVRPLALQDRHGEGIPQDFFNKSRQRAFADRAGSPVNGGRTPRYEQDAAAVEATERIRGKPLPTSLQAESLNPPAGGDTSDTEPTLADIYADLHAKCAAVKNVDDGHRAAAEVTLSLSKGLIGDEQACDLNDVIQDKVNSLS